VKPQSSAAAIGDDLDRVPFHGQVIHQSQRNVRLVFDDENARHLSCQSP
jgi:hypothetical protein